MYNLSILKMLFKKDKRKIALKYIVNKLTLTLF